MQMADDKLDPLGAQLAMRPLRDLPQEQRPPGVVGRQGRPVKIAPVEQPDTYALELDRLRQETISRDPLVRGGPDVDPLYQSMIELAREAAVLAHERRRLELLGRGDGSAQVSSRRVDALARLGAIAVERHRHLPRDLDVRGDKFQRLLGVFNQMMTECAQETLPPADAERFLNRYRELACGWEEKVDPPRSTR